MSYRKQSVGRRTRDGNWQWMIIGIFLGMGCSLVMVLSANLFGFIEFSAEEDPAENDSVAVITTTPQATTEPTENIAPTAAVTDGAQPPTFTPDGATSGITPTPTLLPGGSAATTDPNTTLDGGTTGAVGTSVNPTQPPVGLPTNAPPSALQAIASPLMRVDGGTFLMGTTIEEGQQAVAECISRDGANCTEGMITDSIPPHSVTLDPFQIEQFEVSVGQYVAYLNSLLETSTSTTPHLSACGGPCALTTTDAGGENSDIVFENGRYAARGAGTSLDRSQYPVTVVTWFGAKNYCLAIGRDLPTEAQWERAARGPNNSIYPWGQQWDPNNANTSRSGPEGIVAVTEYPGGQSAYGALNMAGNVAEWTNDWYSANYYTVSEPTNPRGPASGERKVVRGGGWDNTPLFVRTVHRIDSWRPGDVSFAVGFRCVSNSGGTSAVPNNSTAVTAPPTPFATLSAQ